MKITPIKVPSVGESISSGTISAWHQNDGATVALGDLLLTLDTDKVSTEITATQSGLLKRLAAEGEEVKVGQVIAEILENPEISAPKLEKETLPAEAPKNIHVPSNNCSSSLKEENQGEPPVIAPLPSKDCFTRRPMTPLRRKIASQLLAAQQNAAILTTFNEVDMAPIMQLREELQESFQKKYGVKLGLLSFFIKASVEALKAVPAVNTRLEGEELIENHYYDIGVAVATEKGLLVPVLRECDQESLASLEKQLIDYATKARLGKIKLSELQGGVFTISNGGVYGSLLSTPILNPPQSGILGMHKIQERPVVLDGQIVIRPMMYLALSYDHRLIDGREAVTFLLKVKEVLEHPLALFM